MNVMTIRVVMNGIVLPSSSSVSRYSAVMNVLNSETLICAEAIRENTCAKRSTFSVRYIASGPRASSS